MHVTKKKVKEILEKRIIESLKLEKALTETSCKNLSTENITLSSKFEDSCQHMKK